MLTLDLTIHDLTRSYEYMLRSVSDVYMFMALTITSESRKELLLILIFYNLIIFII